MQRLTAAGGVVFREEKGIANAEILLIYRRGVWDLPKGKIEPGESIEECAIREVSEEIGSRPPQIYTRLRTTYHEYEEGGQIFEKTTYWFTMALEKPTEELVPEKEEGIERLEWVPVPVAKDLVGYTNLVSVLEDFEAWYKNQNHS